VTKLGFRVVGGGRLPPVIEEVIGAAVKTAVGSGASGAGGWRGGAMGERRLTELAGVRKKPSGREEEVVDALTLSRGGGDRREKKCEDDDESRTPLLHDRSRDGGTQWRDPNYMSSGQ
jgi:hypothetical protein